jgi:hypothetical protein
MIVRFADYMGKKKVGTHVSNAEADITFHQ